MVVCPGIKLKSQISNKKSYCNTQKCHACNLDIPCKERNYVYKATCQKCQSEYIGCSARPASERMTEYESSIRLKHQNERTALGQHKEAKHNKEKDDIKDMYKFEILAKAKDLNAFIKEGILIKQNRPTINGQVNNGFVI